MADLARTLTLSASIVAGSLLLGIEADARGDTRVYPHLTDFDRIVVQDGVDVTVEVGDVFRVEANARNGDLERLTLQLDRGELVIGHEAGWNFWSGLGRRDDVEVTVSLPVLEEITASSGAAVRVRLAGEGDLVAVSDSGASLSITEIAAGLVDAMSTSGGSLMLQGVCDHLVAEAHSGASLRADDMICDSAILESTGGAALMANVTGLVDITARSGASIRITGGAMVGDSEVSGGASFRAS